MAPRSPLLVDRQEPPPINTSPSHIRLTTAPEYFGSIAGWLFLGFVATQFYSYATSRARDPILLRALVYFVFFVVLFQVAIETFSGYQILVDGWGEKIFLAIPPKYLILEPLINSLLAFIVQNFYLWRIWSFQRSILTRGFCGVLCALSILSAIGGFAITGVFFSIDVQSRLTEETQVYNLLWLICGAIVDIAIAVSTSILLRQAQTKTTVRDTRHVIGKLIVLTIQTGALTAFLAIVILCLFSVESKTGLLQTLAGYMLGKSYALSLLANLNIRGKATQTLHKSELPPSSSFNFQGSTSGLSANPNRRSRPLTNNFGTLSNVSAARSTKWQGVAFLNTPGNPPAVGGRSLASSTNGAAIGTVGSFPIQPDLASPTSKEYESSTRSNGVLVTKHTEHFRESDAELDIDFGPDLDDVSERFALERMDAKGRAIGNAV